MGYYCLAILELNCQLMHVFAALLVVYTVYLNHKTIQVKKTFPCFTGKKIAKNLVFLFFSHLFEGILILKSL